MSLCHVKTVKRLLAKLEHKPQKALSQNFLINPDTLGRILKAADLRKEEVVLEVGPGLGVLTAALLEEAGRVIAVEKDPILATHLAQFFDQPHFTLVEGDILKTDLPTLVKPHLDQEQKAKVIANIPYNITSPLVKRLLSLPQLFSSAILMVQKELAEKMLAKPKDKSYGLFSLFIQLFSEAEIVCIVPANSFHPEPNVDSAVVRLNIKPLNDVDTDFLLALISAGFAQRRKKLSSNLTKIAPASAVNRAMHKLGIEEGARAEHVSKAQFIELARTLKSETDKHADK